LRLEAIVSLGKIGPQAKPVVKDLIGILQAPPGEDARTAQRFQVCAIWSLEKIGKDSAEVGQVLLGIAADPQGPTAVRQEAVTALGNVRAVAKESVPVLAEIVETQSLSMRLRVGAVQALGKLGRAARPAIPSLKKALDDDDRAMQRQAAEALKLIQQ
jgi:HEAT repeat protein